MRNFYNKLICFLYGHVPYVSERWYTWTNLKRKGGKKKGKGIYKRWHKKIHCMRCGKLIKYK